MGSCGCADPQDPSSVCRNCFFSPVQLLNSVSMDLCWNHSLDVPCAALGWGEAQVCCRTVPGPGHGHFRVACPGAARKSCSPTSSLTPGHSRHCPRCAGRMREVCVHIPEPDGADWCACQGQGWYIRAPIALCKGRKYVGRVEGWGTGRKGAMVGC